MSCSSQRPQLSRLLIVEDNDAQRETLTEIFQDEGFHVVGCSTAATSLEALQRQAVATAIVDLRLPDIDGISLLRQIKTVRPQTCVIVHTGFGSYDTAKDAINLGAYAYVEKLSDPAELVKYVHQAITDHLSEALDSSEKAFQQLFDEAPVGYHELDTDGTILRVNRTELDMLGYAAEEMLGHAVWEFCADPDEARAAVTAKLDGTAPADRAFERDYRRKDGTLLSVLIEDRLLFDATGQIQGMRSTIEDITERKQMEQSLRQSEEQFRNLYEQSPLAYQSLDEEGHILVVNPAWLEMLGYTREEVIGRSIGEFLASESVEDFQKSFPHFKETGAIHGVQFEMMCQDGNRITIEADGKIDYDSQGHFQRTHCILRDITDQKRAENVLRKLSTSVEHSPASVMITDCSGAIEYVNPKFTDVTGYCFEEVVGKNPRLLKSGHTSAEEYADLWETILSGHVWRGEFRNKKKNDDLYWETASIAPIRDENRKITHFVAVKEDITERKKTEETLRQREAELAHVTRLSTLGEMVAGIAHEINQPLSAIANYAGACGMTLKARNDPAEQELIDWTDRIAERAMSAGDIVRRLRDFSRRSEPQCDVCNVRESIVTAIELVTLTTGCRDVTIDAGSVDSALDVRVDRVQLQQVLVNLLTNALEAMQELNSHERHVRFQSKTADEFVEISVVDNGPGLPEDNNGNLFNAFVTTKPDGVGMGLAICRSIVGAHDGRMWSTDNSPHGAAFHFTLPRAS